MVYNYSVTNIKKENSLQQNVRATNTFRNEIKKIQVMNKSKDKLSLGRKVRSLREKTGSWFPVMNQKHIKHI